MAVSGYSGSNFAPENLIIGWGAQVSVAQLGARLTAYIETKGTLTTLFAAVRQRFGYDLPEELRRMIAREIREMKYREEMKEWIKITKCLKGQCTRPSHVRRYAKRLADMDGHSKLAKCVRMFTREFGIRPYFVVDKRWYTDPDEHYEAPVDAFLILPIKEVVVSDRPGRYHAAFSVQADLDPSLLAGMTEAQRQQFLVAANTLQLHPISSDDESTQEIAASQNHELTPHLMILGCGKLKTKSRQELMDWETSDWETSDSD